MRPELEIYEQIDRYLGNLMDAAERAAFELRMRQDAALNETVQLSELTNELIVERGLQKERVLLQQFEADYRGGSSKGWKIISGVVLGIVLSAAAYMLWPKAPEVKNQISLIEKSAEETVRPESPLPTVPKKKEASNAQKKNTVITPVSPKETPREVVVAPLPVEKENELPVTKNLPAQKEETPSAKEKEVARVSCTDQLSGVTFTTTPSCKKDATGTIEVKGASRGISLFLDEETISSRVSGLSSGKHTLVVKNQECEVVHTITIGAVVCISNKTLSWSFSDQNQWTIELAQEDGRMVLMDRSGRILKDETVRGNLYSVSSETFSAVGVYQFRVTYPDGESEQGFIQVVP